MFKKPPRHEVISLRLTEDRLKLLERSRQLFSSQLGRPLSLSEAAFLVLEDRAVSLDRAASRFELSQAPTASLARMRQRWESEHTLSAAEWDVLAESVCFAAEERHEYPKVPSRESYLALLDAFEAVYEKRQAHASPQVWSYFRNLGGYHTPVELSATDADQRHRALLDQIAKQRHALRTSDPWYPPGHVGRCFQLAIHEEGVDSTDLDHILASHWPTLWGLAARGHWLRYEKPVLAAGTEAPDPLLRFDLPPIMTLGDFTLSFTPFKAEFAAHLTLARRVTLQITQYPEWAELHAMLDGAGDQAWLGRYFNAFVSTEEVSRRRGLWVRQVCVEMSDSEWQTLGVLIGQAWQHAKLQPWLQELRRVYGEQG
jgi:hypothetical protein